MISAWIALIDIMGQMPVNPRWRRIQELVEAAETWPVWEREQRMAEMEADAAMRAEALDLLDAMEAEQSAPGIGVQAPVMPLPERIGPYKVDRLAGSGGRGGVYRASREVAGVKQ